MAHDPFIVFPRTRKNGKEVYYVRFRDPGTGWRMTARSTNLPSKSAAKAWAAEQWKQGVFQGKASMSFRQYTRRLVGLGEMPLHREKTRQRTANQQGVCRQQPSLRSCGSFPDVPHQVVGRQVPQTKDRQQNLWRTHPSLDQTILYFAAAIRRNQ
jgi:hypothetical protein